MAWDNPGEDSIQWICLPLVKEEANMRLILTFKLFDGTSMDFICDAKDKSMAQKMAINLSHRVLGQKKFFITPKTEIVNCERWANKTQSTGRYDSSKNFSVAVIYNGQSEVISVAAGGTKTAYNQIKKMYNLQGEPAMFVYDITQNAKLGNVLFKSERILYDKGKLNNMIDQFTQEARKNKLLGPVAADLALWGVMVSDSMTGAYKKVPKNSILTVIGIILYFISPINLSFEVIPIIGQLDDAMLVKILYDAIHKDVVEYEQWRKSTALV